jgi:hypothetical protein
MPCPDSKSKIKCHHEGSAPCHPCTIASRSDCLLSAPIVKNKARLIVDTATPSARPRDSTNTEAFLPTKRARLASPTPSHRASHVQPSVESAVGSPDLPTPTLMQQACDLLQTCFPEFGFLHRPSFADQLLTGDVETARLHAILSVTARLIPSLVLKHGGPEAAGNHYASKAETAVMARVLEDPDPAIVQSLLLISLHHWGACNGSRAWMLAGMSNWRSSTMPSLTILQELQFGWRKR